MHVLCTYKRPEVEANLMQWSPCDYTVLVGFLSWWPLPCCMDVAVCKTHMNRLYFFMLLSSLHTVSEFAQSWSSVKYFLSVSSRLGASRTDAYMIPHYWSSLFFDRPCNIETTTFKLYLHPSLESWPTFLEMSMRTKAKLIAEVSRAWIKIWWCASFGVGFSNLAGTDSCRTVQLETWFMVLSI